MNADRIQIADGIKHFLIDVEATGKSSYSGVMAEFSAVSLETGKWFRGQLWTCSPDPTNPAKPLLEKQKFNFTVGFGSYDLNEGRVRSVRNETELAESHVSWLDSIAGQERKVFISDNPGYDFERINVFFDQAGIPNPYGWSSRRIGDYYSGLSQNFNFTSRWKSLRVTKHTHQSHFDAMGNREALLSLLAAEKEIKKLAPDSEEEIRRILSIKSPS